MNAFKIASIQTFQLYGSLTQMYGLFLLMVQQSRHCPNSNAPLCLDDSQYAEPYTFLVFWKSMRQGRFSVVSVKV